MKPWQAQVNSFMGQGGEAAAKRHLLTNGFEILETNWTCKIGEIDIIAQKNRMIIFVEVKTSRTIHSARQMIGQAQQRRIANAAQLWIRENAFKPTYLFRFDAILVGAEQKLQHIEGAWTT